MIGGREQTPERKPAGAAYARVAKDDGQRSWEDIDRQQQRNAAAATRLGIEVVAGFVDLGQSGARTNRPGLNHLLAYADEQPLDYVIVSSIDRLSRRADQVTYLLQRLHQVGVNVVMADSDTAVELVLPSDLSCTD